MEQKPRRRIKTITARKKKGYYQWQVAERVGVATNYLAMVERGLRQPSVEMAKELEEVLGISWYEIIDDNQ